MTRATVTRATDQAAIGRDNGRPAPAPELLQPSLDPSLPSFEPAYDSRQLTGDFHCAASDVLAPLDPALSELTRFILSQQGQQVVRDQGIFLPLRATQSLASAALLATVP